MKQVVSTENAPGAIGPYSQGIITGNLLFTAGQIALNPEDGQLNMETISDEVHQIMKNLSAIAEAGGTKIQNGVKSTIFLTDMSLFTEVNQIYGSYFDDKPPARSTVTVSTLPLNVRVEIDMIIHL